MRSSRVFPQNSHHDEHLVNRKNDIHDASGLTGHGRLGDVSGFHALQSNLSDLADSSSLCDSVNRFLPNFSVKHRLSFAH